MSAAMIELLEEVGGSRVARAMRLMDHAATACSGHDVPKELWDLLCPSAEMCVVDERVYRAHARELVERHVRGEPLDMGTEAEVLLLMHRTSLASPLTQEGAVLYYHVFARVFGDEVFRATTGLDEVPAEKWAGQLHDDLRSARMRARGAR